MLTGSGSCDPEQAGARGGVLPPVRGRVHPGSGGAGSRGWPARVQAGSLSSAGAIGGGGGAV